MNNFYTVLVIPEKTKQVKKIVLPSVYVRVGLLLGSVGIFFLAFMIYDYVNVMRQLSENKRLQTENRQLKQQMQAFTTKLQTVQDALERIQTYTTKLRIITNQAGDNTENLKQKVAPDIPGLPMDDHSDLPPAKAIPSGRESKLHRSIHWPEKFGPLDRSRLLASNAQADTLLIAAANAESPVSDEGSNPPPPPAAEAPDLSAAPAGLEHSPPAPVVVAKPRRKPKTKTESAVTTAATISQLKQIPPEPAVSPPAATFTQTTLSPPPAPAAPAAAVADREKSLSDLIREDEEQESAALRRDFAKLHLAFDSVLQHELAVELDVESLTTALLDQRDYMNSLPTLKPTNGWYTSGFGVRSSPFTGKSTMHEGLDLANHIGSAIVSAAAGVVTFAGPRPGYGNLVTINHGYGIQTQYGHISRAYVKVGEKVKRGQKVAAVGNTGRSTGPHVHYEVRVNGIPMDPYYYILEE